MKNPAYIHFIAVLFLHKFIKIFSQGRPCFSGILSDVKNKLKSKFNAEINVLI